MFLHIEHINHSARGCMHGYGHVGGYKAAIDNKKCLFQ